MERFYSALVINKRLFPHVHLVFKPRYNKEYFRRITANIDKLKDSRCRMLDTNQLTNLKDDSKQLLKLKDQIEKFNDEDKLNDLMIKLECIESRIMPIVVALPNRYSKEVPESDSILAESKSDWPREGVTKMLSHVKLSYINNCYSKSVIGPNSSYYFGIAAKLQLGIQEYFTQQLEEASFIPVSGLCLAKSALVEAVNGPNAKDYFTDPGRVLTDSQTYTTSHLVEASRESLVGFLTTIGHRSSNKPLRMYTVGSGYSNGSDWFDADEGKISQFETVHTLIHTPSIEQYSMKEYRAHIDFVWKSYKKLGLPTRLVQCSLNNMLSNEYDAHRIDILLPSRMRWIEVARISHYLDYITVRVGMKRGHLIDSKIYDSRILVAAIIENNQTYDGKFVIPNVIEKCMLDLKESERRDYFRTRHRAVEHFSSPPMSNVISNYQQRRYLVKKPYLFAHSQRAARNDTYKNQRYFASGLAMVGFFLYSIDWEEVWIKYIPTVMKRFLYDNIFRPLRRIYWSTIYTRSTPSPHDISFDEMDKSHYLKTQAERRKESMEKLVPGRFSERNQEVSANDGVKEKIPDQAKVNDVNQAQE